IGLVLLVAELLLPTHGALGLGGIAAIAAGIVTCFLLSTTLGIETLAGAMIAAPILWIWVIHYWPRTRVGRRLVLQPVVRTEPQPLPVQIGQSGTTVSDLRPTGICDFAGQRIEVVADQGPISRGQQVRIVHIVNRRPHVRIVG